MSDVFDGGERLLYGSTKPPPLSLTIKDKIMSVVMWWLGGCSVPKSLERFKELVPDYFSAGDKTRSSPKRSVRIDTIPKLRLQTAHLWSGRAKTLSRACAMGSVMSISTTADGWRLQLCLKV